LRSFCRKRRFTSAGEIVSPDPVDTQSGTGWLPSWLRKKLQRAEVAGLRGRFRVYKLMP
jgi:hypothetical protein